MMYIRVLLLWLSIMLGVGVLSYIWTAVKILTDNSMSKHKKVCDMCFRDIKKWTELNRKAKS